MEQAEAVAGKLVGMRIVKRDQARSRSSDPEQLSDSRNGLVQFDLVMEYEEAAAHG